LKALADIIYCPVCPVPTTGRTIRTAETQVLFAVDKTSLTYLLFQITALQNDEHSEAFPVKRFRK
jgi:hypothetical protein